MAHFLLFYIYREASDIARKGIASCVVFAETNLPGRQGSRSRLRGSWRFKMSRSNWIGGRPELPELYSTSSRTGIVIINYQSSVLRSILTPQTPGVQLFSIKAFAISDLSHFSHFSQRIFINDPCAASLVIKYSMKKHRKYRSLKIMLNREHWNNEAARCFISNSNMKFHVRFGVRLGKLQRE